MLASGKVYTENNPMHNYASINSLKMVFFQTSIPDLRAAEGGTWELVWICFTEVKTGRAGRKMLDVCLLGTGGMMPLPGRWLTALMTRYNGSSLLIDCGEGTQISIREKGWSFHSIDVICFTHYHGDHISGLPGLLLSMGNADRTEPVTLIGPKGLERVVNALRVIAPELPFDLKFIELSETEETIEQNGYVIKAFQVRHNITCYGYSIIIPRGGRFYTERALENNVPQKFWNRLQKGQSITDGDITYTPDMVIGPQRKGIKLTYCTDTRPIPAISANAAEADLFICEGMYGEDEKDTKAREYKHMTFGEAAKLARTAGVRELWLTHYSPSLIRPEDFLNEAKRIFSNTKTCKDKKSITLEFDKDE
jgi:ribonuclease Z